MPELGPQPPAPRWRGVVEYDGHDFEGWQRQSGKRSVQGCLEEALLEVGSAATRAIGAGRTDRGVHAVGQVMHFDMAWDRGPELLQRALNAVLPRDIAVLALAPAPPGFHARHSAIGRAYAYTIWTGPVRSPLRRRTSYHVAKPLRLEPMVEAAVRLEGEHDFAGFGQAMTAGGPTVRFMHRCTVRLEDHTLIFELEANAFLRHQVRRTVGFLLDVGRDRLPVAAVDLVLNQDPAAPVPRRVPAQGLVLVGVRYPPDEALLLRRPGRRAFEGFLNREDGGSVEDLYTEVE